MAAPKKTDTLKRYQAELDRGINWRNSDDLDGLWRRMIDLYKGRHYGDMSASDRMVVNRAFKTKNVIAPSVAVNNPKFVVNARTPDKAPQAIITEEVLNYLWRAHKYKKEFRLAVDDMLIAGHGWMKVGYKFKKKKVIKEANLDHEDIDAKAEPGVDDKEEGTAESEHRDVQVFDRPFVERISIFDVFVDPDARHLGEARWIAQRVKRNVADVRVDGRYSPTHRKKASATHRDKYSSTDDEITQQKQDNSASKGFVDVWEFYDLREGKVCTFVKDYVDGFLIDPAEFPYAFGHPFVMLRNYEVPDQFYPMGELESIEYLQLELNKTRTEQMLHRRGNTRKYLVSEEGLTDDTLEALHSDEDNVMVKVNTTAISLDEFIRVMPSTAISADQYNMSDLISSDMDDITGVTDFSQTNIRRTATEAAMIQDQQNARASDKLANIEGTLAEIGERLIGLMQQFMTEPEVIRIVGSTAMPTWVTYDKDYISGQFDYEVEGGSTQPYNESFRAQRADQMSQALAPFVQMGVIDPAALARKLLQDGFGVKDPSQFMAPQQQPQQPGMPGEPPMGMPGGGGPGPMMEGMPPSPEGEAVSPIEGIPPELMARLNIEPSPVLQ